MKKELELKYKVKLYQVSPFFNLNLKINNAKKLACSLKSSGEHIPKETRIKIKTQILNILY